jgi:hypothetical protein
VYLKANWLMRLVVQTQYQQGKGYSTVKWLDKFLLADTMDMHHRSEETSQLYS